MKLKFRFGLRQKFSFPTLLVLIVSLSLFTVVITYDQYNFNYENSVKTADRTADLIILNNVENIWNFNLANLKSNCEAFFKDESITNITIFDLSGNVVINLDRNIKGSNDYIFKKDIFRNNEKIASLKLIYTSYYFEKEIRNIIVKMIIITLALFLLIFLVIWLASFFVLKPFKNIFKVLDKISKKDLSEKISITSADEIGTLSGFINDFSDKMKSIVSELTDTSFSIKKSSADLNELMHTVTDGASTGDSEYMKSDCIKTLLSDMEVVLDNVRGQAASTEETSAAVLEISESIMQVANNTEQTRMISKQTTEKARHGKDRVEYNLKRFLRVAEIVRDVEFKTIKLGESSKKIGEILNVIGDIAEQTNLLALNAAIEAARAGEAGKGFAVVADEIQKLAGSSQDATGEIDNLIKEIQNEIGDVVSTTKEAYTEVQTGADAAKEASVDFKDIVQSMEITNTEIEKITAAIEEQSITMKEISESIDVIAHDSESIEGSTQKQVDGLKNIVSTLEGIIVSSENLNNISRKLNTIVMEFKL